MNALHCAGRYIALLVVAAAMFLPSGCIETTATRVNPDSLIAEARTSPASDAGCRLAEGRSLRDRYHHVVIVVLENQNFDDVDHDPYVTDHLSREAAVLTHFEGLFHPSFPNYLAMVSGRSIVTRADQPLQTLQGEFIHADSEGTDTHGFIADHIDAINYAEGFDESTEVQSDCRFKPLDKRKRFASKHVPFLSFAHGCQFVKDAKHFDVTHLPSYAFYSPDLDHDGHDPPWCPSKGRKKAFKWLDVFLQQFRSRPGEAFLDDTLIVVTYDESYTGLPGQLRPPYTNHTFTAFLGNGVKRGYRSNIAYNHFNVLRTVEDILGVAPHFSFR